MGVLQLVSQLKERAYSNINTILFISVELRSTDELAQIRLGIWLRNPIACSITVQLFSMLKDIESNLTATGPLIKRYKTAYLFFIYARILWTKAEVDDTTGGQFSLDFWPELEEVCVHPVVCAKYLDKFQRSKGRIGLIDLLQLKRCTLQQTNPDTYC